MSNPDWREQLDVAAAAAKLPRPPVAGAARGALAGATAIWILSLIYAAVDLPARVPTHWSGLSAAPDSWSSKLGAMAFMTLFPAFICPAMIQLPRLVRAWPDGINLPAKTKQWWLATPERLVEFERRLRQDMTVFVATFLIAFTTMNVAICVAARDAGNALPAWALPAFLASTGVGVVWVLVRARHAYRPPSS